MAGATASTHSAPASSARPNSAAGPASSDHHVTLINLFGQVARTLVGELVERLYVAGYTDVSPAYQAVFENIDRGGTRLTVLAARAGMAHPSMNGLVNVLEQRGYVERRSDPSDGRARLVCLTEKGRQAVRDALAATAEIEAEWCAQTGTEINWRATLSRGLAGRQS
jgi:DNA-binding MarR family transcriptional regulator